MKNVTEMEFVPFNDVSDEGFVPSRRADNILDAVMMVLAVALLAVFFLTF